MPVSKTMVRDALDEHVESEPEDYYPQTAYFHVSSDLSGDADYLLSRLAKEHGLDIEVL
jgi:hypothetical protein